MLLLKDGNSQPCQNASLASSNKSYYPLIPAYREDWVGNGIHLYFNKDWGSTTCQLIVIEVNFFNPLEEHVFFNALSTQHHQKCGEETVDIEGKWLSEVPEWNV